MALRTVLKIGLITVLALAVITVLRALAVEDPVKFSRLPKKSDGYVADDNDVDSLAERLAGALRIPTISYEKGKQDLVQFPKFHGYLEKTFPLVHSSPFVTKEVINGYSLLYTVTGSNPDFMPYLLTAHMDVVPANGSWSVSPFQGLVKDGVIYGRGAIDDKHSVMGILEGLEFLISNGFQPQRSFYIGFGHDEEINGEDGARHIGLTLLEKQTELDFVLDEGFFFLTDLVAGVKVPVAMIGISEKGWCEMEISTKSPPGHSSIPPLESALGILARGVGNLEATRKPSMFGKGPEYDMFTALASHSNVVPGTAQAVINHRIHPAQTLEEVIEHDKMALGDERIELRVRKYIPPMPLSPYGEQEEVYRLIGETALQICPHCAVAPAISPGNTDLKHYVKLTNKLYRFSPASVDPETLPGLHGDDERISVRDYKKVVDFYIKFILNANEHLAAIKKKDEL